MRTEESFKMHDAAVNDHRTFENYVAAYGDLVWAIAKRFTKTAEEAEQATSDIFFDLWNCADKFHTSDMDERCFIYAVARCRIRNIVGDQSKQV